MDRIILEGSIPSPVNPPSGCKFHTRCKYAMSICSVEEPMLVDYGNNHQVACFLYSHKTNDATEG
jgi:oligopeptide/dipeptide ABC transporter ATP-binding protein